MSTSAPFEAKANRIGDSLEAQLEEAENLERESRRGKKGKKNEMSQWEDQFLNAKSQSKSWEAYQREVLDKAEEYTQQQEKSRENVFDAPGKDIEYIENKTDSYSNPEQLRRAVQRLLSYALKMRVDSSEDWNNDEKNRKVSNDPNEKKREYDAVISEIRRLMTAAEGKDVTSPEAQSLQEQMKKLAAFIKPYYSHGKEFEIKAFQKIRSINELSALIMEGADERFKVGGDKELVDKDGKFHPENFEAWVRAELVELATDINPNDAFNAFSEIQAQTPFKSINFMTMYKNLSYWREEEVVWAIAGKREEEEGLIDADGLPVFEGQRYKKEVRYKENEEYVNLRNHLINQLFMFGYLHQFDVDMRLGKGSEAEVPKILAKHSMKNTLTEKRGRMLFLLKLNSTVKRDNKLELEEVMENKEMLTIGTVGKALRRSMLAYYYLGEINSDQGEDNMFEKVLKVYNKDGSVKIDGVEEFYQSIVRHIITDKGVAEVKKVIARSTGIVKQGYQDRLDILTNEIERLKKEQKAQGGQGENWSVDALLSNPTMRGELEAVFRLAGISDANSTDFDHGNLSWKEHAAKLLKKEWGLEGDGSYGTLEKLNLFSQRNAEAQDIKILRDAMTEALMKTENIDKDDAQYAELMSNDMWYSMGMSARNDLNGRAFDGLTKTVDFMRYRIKQGDQRLYPGNVYNMFGIKRIAFTPFEAWEVKRKDGTRTNLLEQLQGGEGSEFNFENFDDFDFEGDAQAHYANDHIGNGYRMYHWLLEEDLDWANLFTWEKGILKFNMKAANDIMDDKYHTIRYTYDNIGPHYEKKVRSAEYVWDPATKKYKVKFVDETLKESAFDDEVRGMGMYNRPELKKDGETNVARDVFAYIIAKEMYAHTKWNSPKEKWGDEQIALLQDFFRKMTVGGFYKDQFGQIKQVGKFFNWNELSIIKEHGGRGWVYQVRTTGGQTILLPFEVLLAIAGATYHIAKPSGFEINLPGVEAIFGTAR